MTSAIGFRSSPPKFKRSNNIEQALNKGGKVEGIEGYVPSEIKCCSGSTTVYIPVKVSKVKLGDCSFSVIVRVNSTESFQLNSAEFSVNPKHFFDSIIEANMYESYLEVCREYNKKIEPFKYSNGTLTKCRSLFREALEQTSTEIREEILAEISDPDEGIKKASMHWMLEWYKVMTVHKLWPNAGPEEEDDEDDDEWDD